MVIAATCTLFRKARRACAAGAQLGTFSVGNGGAPVKETGAFGGKTAVRVRGEREGPFIDTSN
jgi:hypothetical protein